MDKTRYPINTNEIKKLKRIKIELILVNKSIQNSFDIPHKQDTFLDISLVNDLCNFLKNLCFLHKSSNSFAFLKSIIFQSPFYS